MKEINKKQIPLYLLAEQKLLGETQLMDRETLEWIKENASPTKIKIHDVFKNYKPLPIHVFSSYIPKREWFLREESIESIHGIRHLMRVILFTYMIFEIGPKKLKLNLNALLTSAAIHDLRRLNDKGDEGHGDRASKWFLKNLSSKFNSEEIEEITTLVRFHDIPYENIPTVIMNKFSHSLNIIKAADAFDRYRLPRMKWWPNVDLIQHNEVSKFIPIAKYLTIQSEEEALYDKGNKEDSVIEIAKDMSVLKDER